MSNWSRRTVDDVGLKIWEVDDSARDTRAAGKQFRYDHSAASIAPSLSTGTGAGSMVFTSVPETKTNSLAVSVSFCASNATVSSGSSSQAHFGDRTDRNAALRQAG